MHAPSGHHFAKMPSNLLKLFREEQLGLLLANCYSRHQGVTTILPQLDWPTLHDRRDQMKLIMMHKIILGLIYPAQFATDLL